MKKTRKFIENKINLPINKERIILDAKASYKEIFSHVKDNFSYGFCNGIVIAFVSLFINNVSFNTLSLLVIAYLVLKKVESRVLNREKYTTNFGKKYIYPIPSTVGFVLGAYLTTLM